MTQKPITITTHDSPTGKGELTTEDLNTNFPGVWVDKFISVYGDTLPGFLSRAVLESWFENALSRGYFSRNEEIKNLRMRIGKLQDKVNEVTLPQHNPVIAQLTKERDEALTQLELLKSAISTKRALDKQIDELVNGTESR